MKPIIFMSVLLFTVVTGQAMAVCPTVTSPAATRIQANPTSASSLGRALQNRMVCKKNAANTDWEWQEWHKGLAPGGVANNLIDYKKGPDVPPGSNIDPTKPVGKWTTNTTTITTTTPTSYIQTVTYYYGSAANTYTFSVWFHGGTGGTGLFDFCSTVGGNDVVGVTRLAVSSAAISCGPL